MPMKARTISPAKAHVKQIKQSHDSTNWNYGHKWRKLRAHILRQEPFCRSCDEPATEVDHITPLARGGTNDSENLQALCKRCHSRKTATENAPTRR